MGEFKAVNYQRHWNSAYLNKSVSERSWSEFGMSDALAEFEKANLQPSSPIIDIGGGASVFTHSLVNRGFHDLTVLDISDLAIDEAKSFLGERAFKVKWITSDVLQWEPSQKYAYWNDRAVFHFLTENQQQVEYVSKVLMATESGSHIVIATFSQNGPESCSGLPVQRWSAEKLANLFADSCSVISQHEYEHVTPWGSKQSFMRLHLQRN